MSKIPASGTKLFFKSSVNQVFMGDFSFLGSQRVAKNNITPTLKPQHCKVHIAKSGVSISRHQHHKNYQIAH